MRGVALFLLLAPAAVAARADSLVATQVIRAASVIGPEHVALVPAEIAGALADPGEAVGHEARVTIYPGRPVRAGDLRAAALVERNQIVPLVFRHGGLTILAEGRALERGAAGDVIRTLNLASRSTVSGRVNADGEVVVNP
jgi:flagella basal body P-ring formation protein FlgA